MSEMNQAWDDECDVLVVGSGGGALTSAYTAAREGLSVIVVEASGLFGGTTAYSGGGGMWFPNNAVLRRNGSQDTPEDARTYFRAVVGERTPETLQDAFLEAGPRVVDYLEADEAFAFKVMPWPDYFGEAPRSSAEGRHVVMRAFPAALLGDLADSVRGPLEVERGDAPAPAPEYLSGGRALVGRHLLALSRFPDADLRRNARFEELLTADGEVLGAIVAQADGQHRIRARRGVVLAAGGFEHDDQMRSDYGVPGSGRDSMGAPDNKGLAIRAGIAAGADVDLMDQAWWSPGLTHPDGSSTFSLWFTGGIFVDDSGERFVNESAAYDRIGRRVLERVAAGEMTLPYWMVYDGSQGERPPVQSASVPIGETEAYQAAGCWVSADTLAGLAERIGVPGAALEATVARFNEHAAAGRDPDFGRGDQPYDRTFTGGGSPLVPISQGPFHAARFGVSDLGTKGGLRTDEHARVLDREGAVIGGLYAAGNTMAAVTGTTYPGGGNPIGACMVFGHLAALNMAAERA